MITLCVCPRVRKVCVRSCVQSVCVLVYGPFVSFVCVLCLYSLCSSWGPFCVIMCVPPPSLPRTRAALNPYLEELRLRSQALGAELHDGVGAEGVPDAVLAQGAEPQRQAGLQLEGRDQDGLVA